MPEFLYTARDRAGKMIEGSIQAANSAIAVGRVREMGFEVEKVRAADALPPRRVNWVLGFKEQFVYPVANGVPLKDMVTFYRQFSTLISAGIPLYQSLASLEGQTRNPRLRRIIQACERQVERGGPLSEVFAEYPWVFTELQLHMLRAAEHGGLMEMMLQRIADYLEKELALRRLISRLTLYPKIVVFSALFIIGRSFFTDFSSPFVPALSKLIAASIKPDAFPGYDMWAYLNDTLVFLIEVALGIFAVVAFCRISLFRSEAAREGYERFKFSLPGLGSVSKQFALAHFGRAFGAMYAGGLPLNTAIRVAGKASGSRIIQQATERAINHVERGEPISAAFQATGVFPHMVIDMLRTGEHTGNVDAMTQKVSEYLEGDAETRAHAYSHIFATVVYLIVAFLVAVSIIRFYMGYFGAVTAAGAKAAGGD